MGQDEVEEEEEEVDEEEDKLIIYRQILALLQPGETVVKVRQHGAYDARCVPPLHKHVKRMLVFVARPLLMNFHCEKGYHKHNKSKNKKLYHTEPSCPQMFFLLSS